MAFEKRGRHARAYYYHGRREGQKVRKVYMGQGPTAIQSARLDADARIERKRAREQEREQLARYDVAAGQIMHFVRRAAVTSLAVLVALGYHKPAQGSLRRKRGRQTRIDSHSPADAGSQRI